MIIGVIIQQPSDNLDYDIDATKLVGTGGDTLSTVTATVSPAGLSVIAVKVDNTKGKVWVTSGVAETQYKIEVMLTTTNGRIKQDELLVQVKEF